MLLGSYQDELKFLNSCFYIEFLEEVIILETLETIFLEETDVFLSCRTPVELKIVKFMKTSTNIALTLRKKGTFLGRILSEFIKIIDLECLI